MEEFEFLARITNLILKEENILNPPKSDKVVEYLDPNELKDIIELKCDNEKKCNLNELENICKIVIKYSIKTNNSNFHNQLYGGTDLFGLGATWLSESLNTNQHTFEVAPVFSLIEQSVIQQIVNLIGYENGDGIFSPGGSISNMYGMVSARFKLFPQIKTEGYHNLPTLVAYTSEAGHYSLIKAAHWLGIGINNIIKIKTDTYGRLIPDDLIKKIDTSLKMGQVPFFVNATAGTTVLGAIDPLTEIANICANYKLWFHIDACYGGTLMLSKKYKHRLEGLHKSDSISWNPHKMLGAPLQCSLFITKHKNILHESNSASASYLFQQDKFYDVSYDTGDKSIQCGRKVDSFKLWIMWKARGLSGFEELINNAMNCAHYFKNKIQNTEGFKLVQNEFETALICFWYIPKKLRNWESEDKDWWEKINKVAPLIKEKLTKNGKLMIGYSPLEEKGLRNFFRMVISCHPVQNYEDMDFVIKEISSVGENLIYL